jgi:PPM family protein phosphatase
MDSLTCPKCNTRNRQGARFCIQCGLAFGNSQDTGQQPIQNPSSQPVQARPASVPVHGPVPSIPSPQPAPTKQESISIQSPLPATIPPQTVQSGPVLLPAPLPAANQVPVRAQTAQSTPPTPLPAASGGRVVKSSHDPFDDAINFIDRNLITPIADVISNFMKNDTPKKPAPLPERTTLRVPVAPRAVKARNRGDVINQFTITDTIPIPRNPFVIYYQAHTWICPNCRNQHVSRHYEACPICGQTYPVHIIRQSAPSHLPKDDEGRKRVIELSSSGLPGIMPYQYLMESEEQQYIVMEKPMGTWQPMAALPLPQPLDLSMAWCIGLGQTIAILHERGMTLTNDEATDLRAAAIIIGDQSAWLTDLTCVQPYNPAENNLPVRHRDMRSLARLLHLLTTGQEMRATTANTLPPGLRQTLDNTRVGKYLDIKDFLTDLQKTPVIQNDLGRGLRQSVGYATHIGRVREHNEDFVGTYSFAIEQNPGADQTGLYIVADGMGGHQAGEKASKLVTQTVMNRIHEIQAAPALKGSTRFLGQAMSASEVLKEAIRQANNLLVQARQAASSGNDRGTTITAVFISGNSATVANVGDSRTYLLRGGQLTPISKDHSLVASLVSAGLITHEEARVHPQRNQIYRTVGDKLDVEIDVFPQILSVGDILLLCSDGLWEMVRDETIQAILLRASSPQSACDELIQAANTAGGEDNISVIIIKLE